MKPWLLNILACPICKHYPLDPYFFKWENSDEDLQIIASQSGVPSNLFLKSYRHMVNQIFDGTITQEPIHRIKDLTGNPHSQALFEDALEALGKLLPTKEHGELKEQVLQRFQPEVDALYRFLNLIDVEEGLLVCSNCFRWYPIGSQVPAIPEMLPDNLREKEKDLTYMKKWEAKIPKEVVTKGKPFNTQT